MKKIHYRVLMADLNCQEERNSKFKDRSTEIIQSEEQKEKGMNRAYDTSRTSSVLWVHLGC